MIMSEDRDNMRQLLSAYIDGEVTPQQADSIKQAVATDPELAIELHELKAAKRLLLGLPKERAPRGFVRKVMVRAERKHLLGDHHAGGRFVAARWITLAAAATVLLAAGIGIIAINRLSDNAKPPEIAIRDGEERGDLGVSNLPGAAPVLRTNVTGVGDGAKKGVRTDGVVIGLDSGKRMVVNDEAYHLALSNSTNASIYTHNVSDTLAEVNDTLFRNSVRLVELNPDSAEAKLTGKAPEAAIADKKPRVSLDTNNIVFVKNQDEEQVQIVVLATPEVIEKVNGDLNRLAERQMVSQAPSLDKRFGSGGGSVLARRVGPARATKRDPGEGLAGEVAIARGPVDAVSDPVLDSPAPRRAKSKAAGKGVSDDSTNIGKGAGAPAKATVVTRPVAVKAPAAPVAPVVVAKTPTPKPSVGGSGHTQIATSETDPAPAGTAISQIRASKAMPSKKITDAGVSQAGTTGRDAKTPANTGGVVTADNSGVATEIDAIAGADGWVGTVVKVAEPQDKPKPALAKPVVAGPEPKMPGQAEAELAKADATTRPLGDILAVVGRDRNKYEMFDQRKELEELSSQIAKEQKDGKLGKDLDTQYSNLNLAIRQQIFNDDVRRNVQSQRDNGVKVQALVININRRRIMKPRTAATQNATLRARGGRDFKADSAPSTPVGGATTQRAAEKSVKD
jgi:hypothetical protein